MNKKLCIYKFKTPKCNYIYDINTNMLIDVDDKVYESINSNNISVSSHKDSKSLEIINKLKSEGLLKPSNIKIIEHPESRFLKDTLKRRVNTITLQITQQCNLRCKYCVYSGNYDTRKHSNKHMKLEVAKKALDFLIEHSVDAEMLNIGFYGGEPLLRYDFIKECMEYIKKQGEGKAMAFHITTNATLLTPEIIDYFEENNVSLTISLDGSKEIHDKNRVFAANGCGTFDVVMKNLDKIKKNHPEYFSKILFNTVIDPNADFSCTNSFFANYDVIKDSLVTANLINDNYSKDGESEKNERFISEWQYELFKLYLSKLGEMDQKYVSRLQNAYFYSIRDRIFNRTIHDSRVRNAHPGGPCIPGIQKLFVNVDGTFYPCEKVSENSKIMHIGNVDEGFNIDTIYKLLNIGKVTQEQCKNCFAFEFCGLCAAFADNLNEVSKDIRLKHCESTKKSVDNMLKDYCMLKEFGYDFEEDFE